MERARKRKMEKLRQQFDLAVLFAHDARVSKRFIYPADNPRGWAEASLYWEGDNGRFRHYQSAVNNEPPLTAIQRQYIRADKASNSPLWHALECAILAKMEARNANQLHVPTDQRP